MPRRALAIGWLVVAGAAIGVRLWNALTGPLLWGYDAPGHLSYVFFLDTYGAVPRAHQGWGCFHPPLHYLLGWALATLGNAEVLLRGLALVGSAASLAIAALAARVTRAAAPERPALALVAFAAVAFLPVHLYASPMSGNELTAAAFGAAALAALIANERRAHPSLAGDALTGLTIALALLSKFSGAIALASAGAVLLLRARPWRRAAQRAAALGGVVVVLAGPYYARNVAEYGTPFRMNRDYQLTARVEQAQEPGFRTWRDFVAFPPSLFADPRPGAAHLLHSVWGTAYVNAWSDTRQLWNRLPEDEARTVRRARVTLVALGTLPTALALAGAVLAVRDVRRRRRRAVYVPLLVTSALALLAFAAFAARVPHVSALKASYLLGLSLPYGAFVARAVEALLGAQKRWLAVVAGSAVAVPALAAASVHTSGALLPQRPHHGTLGAVHYQLGDDEGARRFFEAKLAAAPDAPRWLEALAAVELADGNPARARSLYTRALAGAQGDASRRNRLAVATALDGDLRAALRLLDSAVADGAGAAARVNRGVVLAALGELRDAERELRAATSAAPDLAPGWSALAAVLARSGQSEAAAAAQARAERAAARAPRGHPYGVGVGLLYPGQRPLLRLDGETLRLARAPFTPVAQP